MKTSALFSPVTIGGLRLKNRIIRAGCFEGMCSEGRVTDVLIEHHRRLAQGGIAMTTLGYFSISFDGRGFESELWAREELMPDLKRFTGAVHREGAAASVQLVHCGFFASPKVIGRRPMGASRKLCMYRGSICDSMTENDIEEKTGDFVWAAVMVREAGFDAVEIHAGHGYLLSQFLSPWTNRRTDGFGGPLSNRIKFPAQVIREVRKALGGGFPILVKMNQTDGFKGGLSIEEAVMAARTFQDAGASAVIPSCGFTAKTPFAMLRGHVPVKEMARNTKTPLARLGVRLFGGLFVAYYPYAPLYLLKGARVFREALTIPVVYVGGAVSAEGMEKLIEEGFPLIQIGRTTIRDSDFVKHLQSGEAAESDCDHCNRCVAAMDGGGVYCVSEEEGLYPAGKK